VSSAPRRGDPRRGRAAQRMVAGREDVRTPGRSLPCPRPRSRRGDVRPTGRADVQRLHIQRPRVRCHPGVRKDRPPVSAALPPRCPRRAGPGVAVGRAVPVGRSGSTRRRGPRAAWSPACIGPDGKGMRGVGRAWLPRGSTVAPRPPLGRRPGCGAASPPGDTGAGPGPGRRPGGRGAWGRSRYSPAPQGVLGRSPAWCSTMGPDQEMVTTLCGRWASGGPVSSSSGGPTRFGGERPAAAARPRAVKSAVRQVLTGP
jgi:hypothetical protein